MSKLVALAAAVLVLVVAPRAWAGPYLNTSALLLAESFSAGAFVRANLNDRDLARNVLRVAQARSDAASRMVVPDQVKDAHPHLLLSLGNMERAIEAVTRGEISTFTRLFHTAEGEAGTFRAILAGQGFKLPEVGCRRRARLQLPQSPHRGFWGGAPWHALDAAGLALGLDLSLRRDRDQVDKRRVDVA